MSGEVMTEQRSAVMVLVDASWEDQNGTLQTTRARMENRSTSGACVRVTREIEVGAQLRIRSHWEEFTGVAKYCRVDGKEYLVGIQRDLVKSAIPRLPDPVPISTHAEKNVPLRNGSRNRVPVAADSRHRRFARRPRANPREFSAAAVEVERDTGKSIDGISATRVNGIGAAAARMASKVLAVTSVSKGLSNGLPERVPETVPDGASKTVPWESRDTLQFQDFD